MSDNFSAIEVILDRIHNAPQQCITFAEYMDTVLYHPQVGYYASHAELIGEDGDFLTSPHLAIDFGEMLAIQLHQTWEILGRSQLFNIVEMGAGRGLLASHILTFIRHKYPAFFKSIDYIIVETSAAMIAAQQIKLQDLPVRWCRWDELPTESIVGCFLSNELIDAFPIHQVTVVDGKLQEIYVTRDADGNLKEKIGELSTDRLHDYWQLNRIDLLKYQDSYRTEVNLAALDWLATVFQKLQRGYIISIDYGYTADRYYNPMRSQGTLQCYFQHAYHNDPYINISKQDITAHVDFTALQNHGELLGVQTIGFTQQGMFLMALGLGDRIAGISTSNSALQSLLSRRQNLHQLIDPMGFGKFGVLIQSKGLTATERGTVLIGLSMENS